MGHEGRERTSGLQEGADGEGFWDGSFGFAGVLEGGTGKEAAIWRTRGTAVSASDLRIGPSGEDNEIGPTGGSVYG